MNIFLHFKIQPQIHKILIASFFYSLATTLFGYMLALDEFRSKAIGLISIHFSQFVGLIILIFSLTHSWIPIPGIADGMYQFLISLVGGGVTIFFGYYFGKLFDKKSGKQRK